MRDWSSKKISAEALKLPREARAELARDLLRSLEPAAEAEIDRLWMDEAERRDREMDDGYGGIPIEEVVKKVRAAVK